MFISILILFLVAICHSHGMTNSIDSFGEYSVNNNEVVICSAAPISRINMYAFHFKANEWNEQVWISDVKKNTVLKLVNQVPNNIPANIRSGKSFGNVVGKEKHHLGLFSNTFNGTIVTETGIEHYGHSKPITWINPLTFYVKIIDGNEQIWIYDTRVSGYIQFGQWSSTSVKEAVSHTVERTYRGVLNRRHHRSTN